MLRRILIIIGYLLLTGALAGGTFALVAYGNDYSYDFATRHIIQNGHVIINSVPGNTRLIADGKQLKKKTPYQASYKVGSHTFEIVKDGYWAWKKTLDVVAGQVSLVRYAVLVPKDPGTRTLDTKPQIVAQSISKDHRHLAYVTAGAESSLYTLDLGNPKPVKLFTTPISADASQAEQINDVTWSDDASHLLVVSSLNGALVHRVVSAGGGEPVNLTTRYASNFAGVRFSASNWRQLYWIAPDGLRRVDIESQNVSNVLAAEVQQFWVEPDHILYVQRTDLGRSLWSLDNRNRHQEVIAALPESESYSVAYVNYRGQDQLAVIPAKTGTATLYTDIYGATPIAKTIAHGVSEASFSPDGHLLVMSAPAMMVTYDLEQSSVYERMVSFTVADQPGQLQKLTWFDSYHLLQNRSGKLYWSEFDGANRVELGNVYGMLPAYGSSDIKSIVMFSSEAGQVKINELQIKQ